jgi:enoyl-CoA hydratase/carnithine racemase
LNKQTLRALNPAVALIDRAQLAMNSVSEMTPFAALLATAYAYADSAEHQEGIAAFLAKRPPRF